LFNNLKIVESYVAEIANIATLIRGLIRSAEVIVLNTSMRALLLMKNQRMRNHGRVQDSTRPVIQKKGLLKVL
jgi:hypothetical protein